MTGYERVLRTLQFEPSDCIPTYGGWINSAAFFEYVTGKNFWEEPLGVACEAYRKLNVDMVFQYFSLPTSEKEWCRPGVMDELAQQSRYTTPEDVVAYVESLGNPEAIAAEYNFDQQVKSQLRSYQDLQDRLGGGIFCMPSGGCPRFTWFTKFGYDNYLMALALYPEVMKRLFEYSAEVWRLRNLVLAELTRQGLVPPFFFQGQDICANQGPMISPGILRSIYFPSLKYCLEPLVEVNSEIIWHSDGYIIPILEDLIACGITGFQGFQEHTGFSVAEIADCRVRSGRKPILLAGISVDRVLPFGTVQDVRKEIKRIITEAGVGGGLVIGTANTTGPDCPNENIKTIYTYTHECSRGRHGLSLNPDQAAM